MRVISVVGLLGQALLACAPALDEPELLDVVFRTESDPGLPLPAVAISVDGKPRGESNQDGTLVVAVRATPEDPPLVRYACPPGYSRTTDELSVRIPWSMELGPPEASRVEITLRCEPDRRVVALVVRTTPAIQLPITVDGATIANTNSDGVALLTMQAAVGARAEIQLDTRARPRLVPASPRRSLTVGPTHDILLFDQRFEQTVAARPQRNRPRIIKIE